MADDADDKLKESAEAPRRVRIDGNEVEQHSLKDQIAYDKHKNAKKASKRPFAGLSFTKVIPPGSV